MPHASPIERHLAEALARSLRERRDATRLTQEQVADAVGISRQHYQLFESGIGNRRKRSPLDPTLSTLVELARALGTEVPDLIDEVFGRAPHEKTGVGTSPVIAGHTPARPDQLLPGS